MSKISLFVLLLVVVGAASATSPGNRPEEYWKAKLRTEMPAWLKARLNGARGTKDPWHAEGIKCKIYALTAGKGTGSKSPSSTSSLFMERAAVYEGASFNQTLAPPTQLRSFLPRRVGDGLPTSVAGLPRLLKIFAITNGTEDAGVMRDSLEQCQAASSRVTPTCVYTVESMADLAVEKLKADWVEALAPTVTRRVSSTIPREFKVTAINPIGDARLHSVTCHALPFPTALYLCHKLARTTNYRVSLVAADARVDTIMVCHHDTLWWDPNAEFLKMSGLKPGQIACHFLEEGDLLLAGAATA